MERPIVEFSLAVKKNKSMIFTRKWVEMKITILSETNYTQKREICLVSHVESEFCIYIHVMQMA